MYGCGSRVIKRRFYAKSSMSQLRSAGAISKSLFKRSNESFSTQSTNFPILSWSAPKKARVCQQPNNDDLNAQHMEKQGIIIPGTFNDWLGANGLSGCPVKPAHKPLTSTWPLVAPLVESGRLVTNYKDGGQATKLKMSLFTFLIK